MRFVFVLIVFLTLLPKSGVATGLLMNSDQNAEQSASLNDEEISNLIGTLEDEKKRQEFIDNLKTLIKAKNSENVQGEKDILTYNLAKGLNLEDETLGLFKSVENLLKNYEEQATTFTKFILSSVTLFFALILVFLIKKISHVLTSREFSFKNFKYGINPCQQKLYSKIIRIVGYILVFSMFLHALSLVWDIRFLNFIENPYAFPVVRIVLNLFFVGAIAAIIWELANAAIDYALKDSSISKTNRMKTLLPIVRNVLMVVIGLLFILVALSEIGIDILPLLAGAGVLGIAIAFGAQTMVKDFLTGFTIILEDLIQVGDVVRVAGHIGLVEKITVRKIDLRDLSGTVHTVPFGEITTIENLTKDFSFYLMDIGVAYREDTDEVISYLKEVDEDMRNDDEYKDLILEPLDILGVDAFADSAVIIKARVKTPPIKQWKVGREYLRRIKKKFDEKGVEIPFPHQTIYFGEDKSGNSPAGRFIMENVPKSA